MQLITMKCPACAAIVNFDNEQTSFKCDFCKNQICIIKPINVPDIVAGLSDMENQKFMNFVSILEQAMIAGNYYEAYNYCNKALEVNPKSGAIWENKAICTFWLSTSDQLANEKLFEIITYLNASKQNDPDSKTYKETSKSLSFNIYHVLRYRYRTFSKLDLNNPEVNMERNQKLFQCLNYMEVCYQIYPHIGYLKDLVNIISNGSKCWLIQIGKTIENSELSDSVKYDAKKKRDYFINIISSFETDYVPPKLNNTRMSAISIIILWLSVFIVISILVYIYSKV